MSVETAVQSLCAAYQNKTLDGVILPPLTIKQAYKVQRELAGELDYPLDSIRAWKVGAPSMEADAICAPIYSDHILTSGDTLAANQFRGLHLELEWAYVLKKDITVDQCPQAMDEVAEYFEQPRACFELVDSRLSADFDHPPASRLAESQASAGIVLGSALSDSSQIAPWTLPHKTAIDGAVLREGIGGHPLKHPANALLKGLYPLLKQVDRLYAGTIIISASWNGMIPLTSTGHITGIFDQNASVEFYLQ